MEMSRTFPLHHISIFNKLSLKQSESTCDATPVLLYWEICFWFWFFFATVSSHVEGPSEKCWEKAPKSSANHGVLTPCQFTGILHWEQAGKKFCHKYFQQIIKSWKKQISVLLRSCCFDRCFKYFFKNFIFFIETEGGPETKDWAKKKKNLRNILL